MIDSIVMTDYITRLVLMQRTGAGNMRSFEVKVWLQQGSVLSPLLCSLVINMVTKEANSRLLRELVQVYDHVLMTTIQEYQTTKFSL